MEHIYIGDTLYFFDIKPPLLVVGAIISDKDNEKVLLVKRAREPFKNNWSLIGGIGVFERTSDPEEAVRMEVKSDINCIFHPTFFTYEYQESPEYNLRSVVLYFHGTIQGDPVCNLQYVLDYKWVPLREAMGMKLGFDHQEILKKFLHTHHP